MSETLTHNVYIALSERVRRSADSLALVYEDQTFTSAELLDRVDAAAEYLRDRGIQESDVVAAWGQNSPAFIFLYYAAAKLGSIFVPFNPNLTHSEAQHNLENCAAKLLFHDDHVAKAAALLVPSSQRVTFTEILEVHTARDISNAVSPAEDVLIMYSSGTTGAQKAIVLDHEAQVRAANSLAEMWDLTADDVVVVALPLGFLFGLSTAAATTLQAGGTVILLRRFHPKAVLEALVQYSATVYHGVPTMFSMMLDYSEQQNQNFELSFMKRLISAGAPLPNETRERFEAHFNVRLENFYAMTEATPVFGRYAGDDSQPEAAVGRLAPGASIRILREDGSECSVGEQGEIVIRAAATANRYWNAPELTTSSFIEGYFKSGDLGYRDVDEYFYLTGRIKDVIIRGGANISPVEVEEALTTHPAVHSCSVIGAPDRIFGEVPVAFVTLHHGQSAAAEELIAHCAYRIADFKVPHRIIFESELPVGKTGKIDRGALRRSLDDM